MHLATGITRRPHLRTVEQGTKMTVNTRTKLLVKGAASAFDPTGRVVKVTSKDLGHKAGLNTYVVEAPANRSRRRSRRVRLPEGYVLVIAEAPDMVAKIEVLDSQGRSVGEIRVPQRA